MKRFLTALLIIAASSRLFAQEALTIDVKTPGTLEFALDAADKDFLVNVKQLKVSGKLNGDDIITLRTMSGSEDDEESGVYYGALRNLDMSEAQIVEGGESYNKDYNFSIGDYVYFSTANDVVGDYMFNNCSRLETIILPQYTKSIGKEALSYCKNLTSVTLPEKAELTIGEASFSNCSSLRQIVIPSNTVSIGDLAFNYCSSLKNVICRSTTPPDVYYSSEWENAFAGTNNTYLKVYVPAGSSALYMAKQGWNQFSVCEYSADAVIGQKLDHISISLSEAGTFDKTLHYTYPDQEFNIKSLKISGPINGTDISFIRGLSSVGKVATLDLSDAQIKAGGSAYYYNYVCNYGTKDDEITKFMFNSCYNLRKLTLPATVAAIDVPGTFPDSLSTIVVPAANTHYHDHAGALYSTADATLRFCPVNREPGTLSVEEGTIAIADSALYSNNSVTAIELPKSLRSIGVDAFHFCDSLKAVTIPEGVTDIADYAFYYAGINQLSLPSTLKNLGMYTFTCPKLETVSCKATTPPSVSMLTYSESFYNVDKQKCILVVPTESINAYKFAPGWRDFANITDSSNPTGIASVTSDLSTPSAFYTASGMRTNAVGKGLKIVVNSKGKAIKVMK